MDSQQSQQECENETKNDSCTCIFVALEQVNQTINKGVEDEERKQANTHIRTDYAASK
jgi:hypothetical protein